MNRVTQELAAVRPADPAGRAPPRDPLDELSIFASIDPLLGDLQRQYKDARYLRRTQEKDFGRDDAMAEIARDSEDSAWCAMQTRYMEVRSDRDMMREMQAIQNEAREAEVKAQEREKQRIALETYQHLDTMERMRASAKAPAIFEWMLLFMLMRNDKARFSIAPSFTRRAA